MKNSILGFVLLLLISCGSGAIKTTDPATVNGSSVTLADNTPKGPASSMPAEPEVKPEAGPKPFTDTTRIGGIMNFLASDDLKGRDSGSEGIAKAAEFIEGIFEQNNISPYFESYRDTLSNFKKTAYNVVGVLEGNDPELKKEFILIGAHYDHIGIIKPVNGDAIANGANDNASGTTTVLELARYFGNRKSNKRSLIFAFFSAEEKGLLGSRHLAEKLKEQELNLYTMLNFEMTGVPMRGKSYFIYITGYDRSNLAEVSNNYAGEKLIGFLPKSKEVGLFKRSDNYPFYEVFQVPSHTFCTFDFSNFIHYHGVGDEVSEMDLDHMAKVVNKMIPVVEGITNAATQEIK
ncbi:M28 family metallopeptidase [Poritiphilus flavus]|uniref:M20/M25/M40 family metallo-hydrolase n=1 Tax=Poritiphilus flavus TaxID=2697053 RepID=A0A6L9EH72_9FLAO|nr:M20/M25/M40 family metallo-hydrolase [Poritiphilus flavus]NAS14147.1 M20/M25/M40 family metallo-hydrolase [Poritiphilus flavus]